MKAIIVGAGIIGLSTAYYLHKKGWDITILDNNEGIANCSHGNMGMIVPSHFVPLAAPGMVSQGIRWMFNSKSPFYVKPSISSDLIQWGWNFIKCATTKHVENSTPHLLAFNMLSRGLYDAWSKADSLGFEYNHDGIIMYFKDSHVGEEEVNLAHKAQSLGLDVAVLSKDDMQIMEPNIDIDALGAVHYKCDAHVNPNQVMQRLRSYLEDRGVEIINKCTVHDMKKENRKVSAVSTNLGEYSGDAYVLCTGSWLPTLAKKLGLKLPLMPGKGYSFQVDNDIIPIQYPAILCEARVALTPMGQQVRIGGTMEVGPVTNTSIRSSRIEGITRSIPQYIRNAPVVHPQGGDVWYGFRPCSPDGLPYIGTADTLSNVFVGGGHAMMGMSLGPATGKLLSELIIGEPLTIDVTPYRIARFH